MNKILTLFYCLIALLVCKEPYPSEKDVLLIDENNFGFALREFKYLLILFYSTDDPNCQEFIPEYEKIASILKKDNFVLAKIDADKSPLIIRHFNVQIFPSIMLLKKTVPVDYKGEKKQEQIISWLKEQTKKEYKILGTKEELEEFKKQHDLCLIFFGKNDNIRNEIDLAERKMDDIPMGIVNSEELIKENAKSEDKKEYFILFTKFDEQKYYLHDLKSEKIIDFYNLYSTPKVIDFAAQTSPVLFNKRFPSLVIFTSKKIKNWDESKELLTKIWPKVNKKVKLFRSNYDEGMSVKLSEFCGVKDENIPKIFIVDPVSENPFKYEFKGKINEDNLVKFVEDWENKKLKPFLRSEPEPDPEDNDGDVYVVVGKTFKKEVLDNDKDVLMYFYAPWCKHCKEFYPNYEKLARKLKAKNPNLIMAKMDATENDIEYFPINKYPTIKFYPGNAKNKEPLHFNNRQTIVELLDFIKSNAYHKVNGEDYDTKKDVLEIVSEETDL